MKLEKIFGERAYVCNLFAFLSALTVSGHFIDQCLSGSWVAKGLYIFIFSFHMPLLIFLVGSIFKDHEDDRGTIQRLVFSSLGLYLLMKAAISIVRLFIDGKWSFSLLSESGAPWIFFSAVIYLLLACCLKRVDKRMLLGFSIILALLCGYTEAIGDFLVLSRTIVFLPFFILGWMCGIDQTEQVTNEKWLRLLGMITLVLALFVTVRFASYGYLSRPLFTGRNAYAALGGRASFGPLYRLLSYCISTSLLVSILTVTPRKSFGKYVDSFGTSFVQIYFWHCPVLYILAGLGAYDRLYQMFGRKLSRIIWVVCALACVVILSAEILKRALAFGAQLLRNDLSRAGVFILVGIGILSIVNAVMAVRAADYGADYSVYQWYGGFYAEEENSLDAVYVGSSMVYTYWEAPLAWNRYGIAVEPLCSPRLPFEIAEYIIREGRKTQPNALYIISVNALNSEINFADMHWAIDNMPLSWNKFQLVNAAGELTGWDWADRLEYLFPLIRYHDRWQELREIDFERELYNFKGGSTYDGFLHTSTNVSSGFRTTARYGELFEVTQKALDSLLEYCDSEQLNVLFVASPAVKIDEYRMAQINTIFQTVETRGYPTLDMRLLIDDIGLDLTKDYHEGSHTNIHGAIKVTDYLARYLVENYGFTDKRGDPAYSSWDDAYSQYTLEYASPNVLDVEWEGAPRDFSLSAPELTGVTVNGTELTVKWKSTPNANGYRIYRKLQAKGDTDAPQELCWQALDTVGTDVLDYTDQDREVGRTYFYTVIPYREKDGIYEWGDYNFSGVSGQATLNAPTLLSLEGTENDLTLTWEAVEGADGYNVYRKLPEKSWIQIGSVEDGSTSYTDTAMLADMPYQYRVRAYYYEEDETTEILGSFDADGLIWVPEQEPVEMQMELKDGVPTFHWQRIEGISGYTVYRRTHDSDWEQLCTDLTNESTSFQDILAQAGTDYSYRITPYIKYKGETYEYELVSAQKWIKPTKTLYRSAMPEILSATQTTSMVCLTWERIPDVSSYRVYRRALADNGSWSEWTSITSSTADAEYLDKPGRSGEYEYMVRVLVTKDGVTYLGDYDESNGYGIGFYMGGNNIE